LQIGLEAGSTQRKKLMNHLARMATILLASSTLSAAGAIARSITKKGLDPKVQSLMCNAKY
jgi:hypothetical protein